MPGTLHWETVTPPLKALLMQLMENNLFLPFRLVGGTALSLQLGHRISVDIDLFTDAPYDTINFDEIDCYLRRHFSYVSTPLSIPLGMGRSYFIGATEAAAVKLDLYYTDPFIYPEMVVDHIRMAALEDIIAMKIDVIQRGGRKKDFWDLHEIMEQYTVQKMIGIHRQRYFYNHNTAQIRANLKDFTMADDDFEPICLRGKHWEIIKLEIIKSLP